MEHRVLFVTYGGGHAQMVIPVIAALKDRVECLALGLPAALRRLKADGLEPLSFKDFVDPQRDEQALLWGEKLSKLYHSKHTGIPRAESVAYLGLSFADLVAQHGINQAFEMVQMNGRNAFHPLGTLERIITAIKPDMVVATSSPRAEAAALEVARSKAIPSLAMIDLFSGIEGHVLAAEDATFLTQLAADLCEKQGLLDRSKTNLHILGNPAFDHLIERRSRDCLYQGSSPRKSCPPEVLHADMPAWLDTRDKRTHTKSEDEIWREMSMVHQACLDVGARYLVRPHPSQSRSIFERFASANPTTILAHEPQLHDLIERVDLVVARSTTVAIEAVYLGQNVLQLEPARHGDLPLVAMGVAAGVEDLRGLAHAVRSCLEDTQQRAARLSSMKTVLPQKKAAVSIADLILKRVQLDARSSEL